MKITEIITLKSYNAEHIEFELKKNSTCSANIDTKLLTAPKGAWLYFVITVQREEYTLQATFVYYFESSHEDEKEIAKLKNCMQAIAFPFLRNFVAQITGLAANEQTLLPSIINFLE